jgi:hypothetical protein
METKVSIEAEKDEVTLVCDREVFKALGCAALMFLRVGTHITTSENIYEMLLDLNADEVEAVNAALGTIGLAVRGEKNRLRAAGIEVEL